MSPNFKDRVHDLAGREFLEAICVGDGLEVGSADRPISKNAKTLDIEEKYKPEIVADMLKIPLENDSQDFLVASHALEHTEHILVALKEWYRVLKKGGEIGIMVPHGEFVPWEDLGDSELTHKSLLTEKTLELYLKHVGFQDVIVRRLERPLARNEEPAVLGFAIK